MTTTKKNKCITLGDPKSYSVDSLALSLDGKTLAASGWFGGSELYAFKISKRPRPITTLKKPREALHQIALTPDGSLLIGATRREVTRTRLSGKGTPFKPLKFEEEVHAIAVRPDGAAFAVTVGDALVLYDTQSGEELDMRRGSALSACTFASDERVVGINNKGALAILDADLNRVAIVATGDRMLAHLAAAEDYVALASNNPKTPIRVFSISKKKTIVTLPQHESEGISGVALSRDGSRLASAGEDGHVRVWDIAKQKLLADLTGKQEAMGDVVFLDDGRVAAGGRDVSNGPPVYIWEI